MGASRLPDVVGEVPRLYEGLLLLRLEVVEGKREKRSLLPFVGDEEAAAAVACARACATLVLVLLLSAGTGGASSWSLGAGVSVVLAVRWCNKRSSEPRLLDPDLSFT